MYPRGTLRRCALVLLLSLVARSIASAQASAAAVWQATPASVLKNTLRTVTAAELRYFQSKKTYAAGIDALSLQPEHDVQVQILGAGPQGWQARATHRLQPGKSCVIFVGRVDGMESPRTDEDHEMAGEEGVPICDWMR
jgi:hypothetical protein